MTQNASAPVVEIVGLSKQYGDIIALQSVDLTIPPGIVFGIIGPSGAGKTTLIRAIAGALKASSGDVRVFGHPMPNPVSAGAIGYMTQAAALYEELSLRENLLFFGEIYGLSGDQLHKRIDRTVADVELSDRLDSPIRTFSGGMRRRSALAVAMLHEPDLLILDEPTVGLDPVLRSRFWGQFRELVAAGKTLIVSSHVMDEAARADTLAFIRDGRILANGSPAELRRASGEEDMERAFLRFAGVNDGNLS